MREREREKKEEKHKDVKAFFLPSPFPLWKVTDLSADGGVVGELVFKLLNAFNHLCLVLPVEPFDIFRLLTPSGWPASPAPNSSFWKSKRTSNVISALRHTENSTVSIFSFPLTLENSTITTSYNRIYIIGMHNLLNYNNLLNFHRWINLFQSFPSGTEIIIEKSNFAFQLFDFKKFLWNYSNFIFSCIWYI